MFAKVGGVEGFQEFFGRGRGLRCQGCQEAGFGVGLEKKGQGRE